MRIKTALLSALSVVLFYTYALGQNEPIYLTNPSFEDMPRHSKPPRGWYDCGFPSESAPDVQPMGGFSVKKPPIDGHTYLGMVVRDNDTWELVSQRLSRPLKKGQCYEFSIFLSRSEIYLSQSRVQPKEVNYNTPAKLRIYGGFGYCDKAFLLAETKEIVHYRWLEYNFKLKPIDNYSYLVIEAFYRTPTLFPYNGNILIDHASALTPIPCDEEVPETTEPPVNPPVVASAEPDKKEEPSVNRPRDIPKTERPKEPAIAEKPAETTVQETENPAHASEPVLSGVKRSELRKGQTIRIENLYFDADTSNIKETSHKVLDEIYSFLEKNGDVIIEIGGHTNNRPSHSYCDRLSTERAKAVADYLSAKGINRSRLQYKGYGKRQPLYSNKTSYGRKRNQRVEIKILSFDG